MLYEYVLENGVWKLHWGGRFGQDRSTPACKQREVAAPVVVPQRAEPVIRREEPVLVLQA